MQQQLCAHMQAVHWKAWEYSRLHLEKQAWENCPQFTQGTILMVWGRAKLPFEIEMCTSIFLKRFIFPPGTVDAGVIGQLLKGLAALAECSWFRKFTVSKEGLWCHGKICVPFPTTVVNENVQLRNSRASVSVLTRARPFSCIWKNMKWYECCDRPSTSWTHIHSF